MVFYEKPYAKLERVLVSLLRAFPRSWRSSRGRWARSSAPSCGCWTQLAEVLGCRAARSPPPTHHESHAASAFFPSPFARAAVSPSTAWARRRPPRIWPAEGRTLHARASIDFPHSLGLLYAALTAYLGFEVNEGEYKVMGLAAFGAPRFRDEFARLITIDATASFELALRYFAFTRPTRDVGFSPALETLLGPRRPPGTTVGPRGDADDRRYADVAATLQAVTEDALLALARARAGAHGRRPLPGRRRRAQRVANARLPRESGLRRASSCSPRPATRAARSARPSSAASSSADSGPPPLRTAALGRAFQRRRRIDLARALGLDHDRPDDRLAGGAHVARGDVVAFARGPVRVGPARARTTLDPGCAARRGHGRGA